MKNWLFDANVLVRFLVQDDPRQSPAATQLLLAAERKEVKLHLDVQAVAEVVYVLMGRYGRKRLEVARALLAIMQSPGLEVEDSATVVDALNRFGSMNVDFSDAWLAARAARTQRPVASFDRDLDKFKDIQRVEPTV
jgi:predicted nucleic-acid-binding protein